MLRRFCVACVLPFAVVAVATLSACGSGGSDAPDLAGFAPADTAVFVQAELRPDEKVAERADAISQKLTGTPLAEQVRKALKESDSEVDFEADVEPWLGDSGAVFGEMPGTSGENRTIDSADLGSIEDLSAAVRADTGPDFTAVIEVKDSDAAQAFIDGQATPQTGEYEGHTWTKLKGEGQLAGLVDDHYVSAADQKSFKAVVDASQGESLRDQTAFTDLIEKADKDSIANVYIAGSPAGDDADAAGLYKALGVDPDKTGAVLSLIPGEDLITLRGYTDTASELGFGAGDDLVAGFPADSLLALGIDDVGENVNRILDALDKEGIPGQLEPGEVGKTLDEVGQMLDLRTMIGDIEKAGLFLVPDQSPGGIGVTGALVLTSSDVDQVRSAIEMAGKFAGGALGQGALQPLKGGLSGIKIKVPDAPGGSVVFAVGEDRVVVSLGVPAARQAINGGGQKLADSPDFKAAGDSVGGDVAFYGNPDALAGLVEGATSDDPEATKVIEVLKKFSWLVGGVGSDDGTFEFTLGLD